MCSGAGPMNIDVDEIRWNKYRCEDCGKGYKRTVRKCSICPDCKSENVVMM
jgi:predicted Zn-ribbon and HTH transcriptional regulator